MNMKYYFVDLLKMMEPLLDEYNLNSFEFGLFAYEFLTCLNILIVLQKV